MLQIKTFVFNIFVENTYVVYDDETKEAIVIDAGCYDDYEFNMLLDFISKNDLNLKYIINTHCHLDHILGNLKLKDKFQQVPLIYPKEDEFLVDTLPRQMEAFGLEPLKSIHADIYMTDDLKLSIGKYNFEFIFTPGHTPGEFCIYFPEEKILFSGDVLFKENIGRWDLWGGDRDTLIDSIVKKLFTLPKDVVVYPGHGKTTTIEYEQKFNIYFSNFHRGK